MKAHLTYFKSSSGKYYTSGELDISAEEDLWAIWDRVSALMASAKLPGLCEGHGPFTVLVNVPGHQHEHPRLIFPGDV